MNSIILLSKNQNNVDEVTNIITKNKLGEYIILDRVDGRIFEEIEFNKPYLVIVDFDLILSNYEQIIAALSSEIHTHKLIVIGSNLITNEIKTSIYNSGTYSLIKSPINESEFLVTVQNAIDYLILARSMSSIQSVVSELNGLSTNKNIIPLQKENTLRKINKILASIGLVGESASEDLSSLILNVRNYKSKNRNSHYVLNDMYIKIAKEQTELYQRPVNPNTIEQRIRRTVQKGLTNIAEIGLNDYSDPIFSDYSSLLYDFSQVRQEINYINKKTDTPGKINIRKFIEGIISRID